MISVTYGMDYVVLEKSGKTFIEESLRPPFARQKIPKPLMGYFMGDYFRYALFVGHSLNGVIV